MSSAKSHRILQLITRLDRGGSAELTLELCRGLALPGNHVLLISGRTTEPAHDPAEFARRSGFALIFIPELIRPIHPFMDFIAAWRLFHHIKRFRPHILHTNSSKAGIIGRIVGHLAGVPVIIHSPHGHIFYGYYSKLVSRLFIILEKIAAHYCQLILNLTEFGRRDHIVERIAPASKFIVSSCGVFLQPFREVAAHRTYEPEHGFTIGWVGRLVPIKNPQMLLRAALRLQAAGHRFRFLIAGDGELMSSLRQLISDHGIRDIELTGYSHAIAEVYARCDLYVITSHNEGFGRTIVEAMASGLPVIGTRVGGIPEIIADGINGYLVEPDDDQQLAAMILKVAQSSQLRRTFAINNIKKAEFYAAESYIKRIADFYNRYG